MAGRIPKDFIENLLSRIDIVDVIDKRISLKKAGRDYQALCPFHNEKTPSFTVSQRKQFYHCFGCGMHGSAIGFLMDYEHLSFVESVEELARDVGMEVPHEAGIISSKPKEDHTDLYQLMDNITNYYKKQLRTHAKTKRAIDFLKSRGLSGEIAKAFEIGYAPPGWDNIIKDFGSTPQQLQSLQKVGMLAINDKGKRYDKFRDRIMFPIKDSRGRTCAFGGRVIDDENKPKYLNSPETPVFHKSDILYNLYDVRRSSAGKYKVLVVEGYMDVVALAQFDIHNAVATLGTATTHRHLEQLFRTTMCVIFCFDGDQAGLDAAWKALNTSLPILRSDREVRFLFLPEGEDPDTLIRKIGTDKFNELIDKATPLSRFLLEHLMQDLDLSSKEGKARLADSAYPLVDQISDGPLKTLLQKDIALKTGVEPKQGAYTAKASQPQGFELKKGRTPVRHAIRLLLETPALMYDLELDDSWKQYQEKGTALLIEMFEYCRTNENVTTALLIEHFDDKNIRKHLFRLAATELDTPVEGIKAEFVGVLIKLSEHINKQHLLQLLKKPLAKLTTEEKALLRKYRSET